MNQNIVHSMKWVSYGTASIPKRNQKESQWNGTKVFVSETKSSG
jgi:hypothetical protein